MKRYSVLDNVSSDSDVDSLNKVTEEMKKNRIKRYGISGDVDGYLQFLEDRESLFKNSPKKRMPITGNSTIL